MRWKIPGEEAKEEKMCFVSVSNMLPNGFMKLHEC